MSQDPLPIIRSPTRLAALHQLGLLGRSASPAFDRLTSLAARVLRAPVALVSLVDAERQFFKSAVGLQEPWAAQRETPLSHSFCQHVVASGQPLIIADAREHPLLHDNLAISDMGVVAYAGVPLITANGQRLGSFCVIDHVPRIWTEAEIDILRDLSASVITEIELLADNIERAQAELALAEREAMLRSIGDNLPNGMIFQVIQTAADQLQFTYVSEGAARATNATPAQIYADPAVILNQIIEEDRERYWAAEAESFRDLSVFDIEVRMRQPSGAIGWRHIRSQPRYLSDGRLAWDGFSIDITERKCAEEALRESEERARRLSEVAFEGLAIHDQGVIIDANQALASILGYEHTEIIGMSVLDFAAPESRDLIIANIRAAAPQPYEVIGLRKDGTRIIAEIQAKPISYQGRSVRVTAIRDITARKQAEAALRESEARYRSFFEHSIDAILLTAPDGRVFAANPAACRIFGRSEEEICQAGRNGLIDTTDARLPAALEQRARTGMFKGELTFLRRDGTLFPGELSTGLFQDRDGMVKTSMIIRDITERKRAEQEREQLIDALQEAVANIKTLRGMLPICASCKKIRDDSGYWRQIEAYVQAHSDAVFSHGICPDCARQLYGDLFEA